MSRKPKKRRALPPPRGIPKQLAIQWEEAEQLQQQGRWQEARELLDELDQRYPNRIEVLASLAIVLLQLGDSIAYQDVCEQVVRLRPNDPDVRMGLIGAYAQNDRPVLAMRAMQEFLRRWPDHAEANEMRESVAEAERELLPELARQGLDGEESLALATLHEEAQAALAAGRVAQVLQLTDRLLRARPRFAPALNNASLAHWMAGNLDAAIATAPRVLEFDPNNIHALANLCRFLLLKGDTAAARSMGERLRACDPSGTDVWTKRAEAFSYLGEDERVLEVLRASRGDRDQSESAAALLLQLAGAAAMRLGQVDEARRHWKEALRRAPAMELPRENLEDSELPIGERHGGWPFSLPYWLLPNALRDLARRMAPAVKRGDQASIDQAVSRFARDHPEAVALVPHLLDRGDPPGRTLAIQIARSLKTPALLEALRDFALGQRGPDSMRMEAAQTVSAAGLLPQGTVRFWSRGEWADVLLMGFEIDWDEEEASLPARIEDLLVQARETLERRQPDEAESLLQQALALAPHTRELEQTLAATYLLQGRQEEAEALASELHQREPDYVFARTLLAQLYLKRDQVDQAKAIVEPLLTQKRFHISEWGAFCTTQIQIFLAEGQRDSARSWLGMWESMEPDNPTLEYWRQRIEPSPRSPRLFGRQ